VEARFSAPVHTGPGAHPASYTGYRVFPGGKTAGAWRWPSTPSSAEVKENVELYLYSLSGPSWPILGWTLRLPLLWYVACSMCVVYSVFLFSCGAGWVLKGKESIKVEWIKRPHDIVKWQTFVTTVMNIKSLLGNAAVSFGK